MSKNERDIIEKEIDEMLTYVPCFANQSLARDIRNLINLFGDSTQASGIIIFLEDISKSALILKKLIEKKMNE